MYVVVKIMYIYYLFGNLCLNFKKKIVWGYMWERLISFYCVCIELKSVEIMLYKLVNV